METYTVEFQLTNPVELVLVVVKGRSGTHATLKAIKALSKEQFERWFRHIAQHVAHVTVTMLD